MKSEFKKPYIQEMKELRFDSFREPIPNAHTDFCKGLKVTSVNEAEAIQKANQKVAEENENEKV